MKEHLIGGGTAATTGWIGVANLMEMIPDDIANVACLIGIIGTVVAIVAMIIKSRLDSKKTMLEIKKLKIEIAGKK